jgi:2',5'-phosphodiesterase
MREMLDSNADIYCLQEVAGGAHETQLKRFLSEGNFDWHFFGKESLANNGNPIGVSISLRKDMFQVVSEFKLSLGKEGLLESSSCLTEGEKTAIETQFGEGFFAKESPVLKGIHTVAGVVHARTIPDDRDVLVANTHLFFHPFGGHIRILQGVCLMRKLEILRQEIARPDAPVPAIILCGDFNSRPDSGSFEVMSTGRISAQNQDWQYGRSFRCSSKENPAADEDEAGGQEILPSEKEKVINEKSVQGVDLSHPLSLGHIPSEIPELTHATASFRSTLDYIFYSSESFEAQEGPGTGSSIPELTNAEVDRMGGLPCDHYGSDHVLVCGDLRFVGS